MMIETAELMISCMKDQEKYTRFKVKYIKKETIRSITPWEEENSTLAVDTEEEEWAEAEEK
jgi:hypothetical protein